jgi:hypothetical protein
MGNMKCVKHRFKQNVIMKKYENVNMKKIEQGYYARL